MNKIILSLAFILLSTFLSLGKPVELERAHKVAASFLSQQNEGLKSVSLNELVSVVIKLPAEDRFHHLKSVTVEKNQLVYLFKTSTEGFVLVSGEDRAKAILGYSLSTKLNEDDLPVNFLKWIEEYKKQLRYLRNLPEYKSSNIGSEWEKLERGEKLSVAAPEAVSPLMTTQWNQSPYYNELCPKAYSFSEKAVTGCVATAMAQIMKYHNYPVKGSGIHSYYHTSNTVTYGNLSANFGATTYDWANMPDRLSSSSSTTQVNAVATLMLHCGIGVNMGYDPEGSYAWVIEEYSREETCAEYAFKEFFNYDESSVHAVIREKNSNVQWMNILNTELDAGRPVLFAGVGDGGGHAFVADGYDNNNYYHMNWGWGGNSDGYYSVDAFDPVDLGTGAGNGSYNSDQRIVAGIQPPSVADENDLRLYSAITVPEIYQLQEFSINLSIGNYGSTNFTGELGAALFNSDGDFVEFIETFKPDGTLESMNVWTVRFDSEGLSAYPGNYSIGIYCKPLGENWIALGDGDFQNFKNVEILSPFGDSDISLYSSIQLDPSPLITGQTLTITADIVNFGNVVYEGEFGAGLFTMQGDVVQTIEIIDAGGLSGGYFNTYTFSNTIEAEPGSYILALVHFPSGTEDQIVISPSEFINPIEVNVTVPVLGPDGFENNDDTNNASSIIVDFENDYGGFYTIGTSIHSSIDEDYFKIGLPEGYNYIIWARAYDSYYSEEEDEYTCDVIWAHTDNDEWSDLYDDEMDDPFEVQNGGVVYFGVLSYFEGQTGSYSFSVDIIREVSNSVDEKITRDQLKIYPNPVSDRLFVNGDKIINTYQLIDNTGKIVKDNDVHQFNFEIDISFFSAGIYFLKMNTQNSVETQKIIIHE